MSVVIHARVVEQLTRLRLRYVAERLDAVLNDAARTEPTYLDFLDGVLRQEVEAKQRTRTTMGLKIAHFPTVKTLDDFDFKFQPSVDQRLVRELATSRFLAQAENVVRRIAEQYFSPNISLEEIGAVTRSLEADPLRRSECARANLLNLSTTEPTL